MNFFEIMGIELTKVKRTMILPIIVIPPLIVVISGIANLSRYLTPEYTKAWAAMFIQIALVNAYYLLPLSMVVVCVMIFNIETKNNGVLKMLSLPINKKALSLAKFCVAMFYLFVEMVVFLAVFLIAGVFAANTYNLSETIPTAYLLKNCAGIFLTMLPCLAVIWAVTVLLKRTLPSIAINIFLVIPGVLVANTPLWVIYPYCYSGYFVSSSLHDFTAQMSEISLEIFTFVPIAIVIFAFALILSAFRFGKTEGVI
jgi:hypothetical protein